MLGILLFCPRCLIFAHAALCTSPPTHLASSEQYPSAALPYILADGLFINAPPSSPSPTLFLSSIISQLSLSFLHYCFLPSSLSSPPLPTSPPFSLCISSHPFILCILPLLLHFTTRRHLADSLIPSHLHTERHMFSALFSASLNLCLPTGCCATLSSPPHLALVHLQIPPGRSSETTTALYCWPLSLSDGVVKCFQTVVLNLRWEEVMHLMCLWLAGEGNVKWRWTWMEKVTHTDWKRFDLKL